MSAVVGRSHGGDAGGDPPPGSRRLASGCASNVSKKLRGKSKNKTLREIWEEGGKKPLAIKFDVEDQKTYRPVGALSKKFVNFVGIEVRKNVKFLYDKWENVPEEEKRLIWPPLHMYFDLVPHLRSDYGNELKKGIDSLAGTLYRDAKSRFKKTHYEDKGGLSAESVIRNQPPPNMSVVDWGKHIDFYKRDTAVHKSIVNKDNRKKQKLVSKHGTKSIVEHRYEHKMKEGMYPSLIDGWKTRHTDKSGEFQDDEARNLFAEMEALRRAQTEIGTVNEEQILEEVLGKRRGFNLGRGRVVKAYSSSIESTAQSYVAPTQRVYTQEEVDKMFASERERTETQIQTQVQSQMNTILQNLSTKGIHISIPEPPTSTSSSKQTPTSPDDEEDDEDDDGEEDDREGYDGEGYDDIE